MHEVRDGSRVMQFEGELIGESSSWQPGSYRWVEFNLFKTRSGSYVLSRIGHTRLFHDPECAIVQRNHLKTSSAQELTDEHIQCDQCNPSWRLDTVAIERPRYYALVSDSPEGVLEALYKYDASDVRYLTRVAQRLIEKAGEVDARLDRAYKVEIIH